jgi:ankyrin repeat protein
VRFLIGRGADVGSRDDKGLGALHYAAMKDRSEVAQALLAAGADPLARDDTEFGYTAFHVAVHYDARATLAVLLAHEAAAQGVNLQ